MTKKILLFCGLLLLLFGIYKWAFYLGKNEGNQAFIQHQEIVKDIAELGSLQVDGISKYKVTNKDESVSWSALLNNVAFERTVQLDIPYTAKFGLDLNKDTFQVSSSDKEIVIRLPEPILLSLEMKLDQVSGIQKSGWLVAEDSELYLKAQKQLYQKTRLELSNDKEKKTKAKESLSKIFKKYFAPAGKNVQVLFGDEKPNISITG